METARKILCQPCITVDKEEREAEGFCVKCADYLCTNCTLEHGKNKLSRNHTILSGNEMPKECKVFEDMKRLMTCQIHTDFEVSFRCVDHDNFVCVKCVTANHKGCEKVEDVCDTELNSEDTVTRLKDESTKVKAVLAQKHENITWLANEKTRIEKERKEFVERVNQHVLKLIEASREHTEMVAKNAVRDLKREVDKCTEIAKRHDYCQDLFEVAMKYGTNSEKNTVTDFVQKELQKLSKEIKEHSNGKFACLRFEPTTQFESFLSFGDILVEYCEKQKDTTGKLLLEVSSDEFAEQETQPESKVSNSMFKPYHPALNKGSMEKHTQASFMTRQVSKKSTQKVRINTDKQVCSVNGIVNIEGKCYIVTDCRNMTVKLLRHDFTVSESVILEARPIDICKAANTKVAVLSGNRKILIFAIISASISLTASHDTILQGVSITCDTEKQDFIIMFSKSDEKVSNSNKINEIQVRSLHNYSIIKTKMTTFETRKDHKGVLPNSDSIHFSNKRKLLVSSKKGVHCLNMPSANPFPVEDWFYKGLNDVTDIDTDNEGNVYICVKASSNIHQVSGQTDTHKRVLISDITNPLSVCVDCQNELLLIGCDYDDYIHVYKLQLCQ